MPPPPPPNSTPHLLDLSPSDHLSDHKALPLPGQKTEDSHSQEQDDGYPDRSTYQTLPDTPGTPPSQDPFAAGVSDENLIPIEADPVAVDDNEHEDVHYDLNALRSEYKRSFVAPSPGLVRRDIGVIRRHTTSTSRGPAPPKPLSPVLSLVGGDIKREKGDYAPPLPQTSPKPSTTTSTSNQQPHHLHRQHQQHHHRPQPQTSPPLPTSKTRAQNIDAANTASPIPNLPAERQSGHDTHNNNNNNNDNDDDEQLNASDDSESISAVSGISSASMEEEESWIASFCNVVGHEYFAEVTEDFIEDDFNLTGLGAVVPMYKEALEMILDVEPEDDSDSPGSASESLSDNPTGTSYRRQRGHARTASDYSMIETSSELLYGLIHQRFITSRQGIQVMYDKYLSNHFGFCPRVNCASARVLPCGYSDTPGTETVKLFCPSCCDIYVPPNSRFQAVDGAYFGTTFPTLFLMTFPELDISGNGRKDVTASSALNSQGGRKGAANNTLPPINGVPSNNIAPGLGKGKKYEMRIYGFRVNERARSGPRMGWLRDKPEDLADLDEWARFTTGEVDGYESEEEEEEVEDEEEEEDGDEEMAFPDGGGGRVTRSAKRAASNGGDSVR